MIDLHSHILPGLDDGSPDPESSVAMARIAVADGVRTIVATPHVNSEYDTDLPDIAHRSGELNIALARAEVPLAVLTGAEVAMSRIAQLSDERLQGLCLGTSRAVLVESPYTRDAGYIDELLFGLQVRGFRPVLAHPERSPFFQRDSERLRGAIERGVLCSVNAGSMAGVFGKTVRRFAQKLFEDGLVHNVSSDAHDQRTRSPRLVVGFERIEADLPGVSAQRDWYTRAVPEAILAGDPLPPRPEPLRARPRGWRLLGRG